MKSKNKYGVSEVEILLRHIMASDECEKHEVMIKSICYYKVLSNPDLTEGRGWTKVLYIAVLPEKYKSPHLYVYEYLIRSFKTIMAYVQGCSLIDNFTLPEKITREAYMEGKPGRIGDYPTAVESIFLSPISIDGFPERDNTLFGRKK